MTEQPDRGIVDIVARLTQQLSIVGADVENITVVFEIEHESDAKALAFMFTNESRMYDLTSFRNANRSLFDGFKLMGLNMRVAYRGE